MAESHADGRFEFEDWIKQGKRLQEQSKVKELRKSKGMRWEDCPPDMMLFDNLIGDVKGTDGTAAILFNLVAEMIAHLSFAPGGVPYKEHRYIAAEQTMGLFTGWNKPVFCSECNRELTNEESKKKGIGPICEHNRAQLDKLINSLELNMLEYRLKANRKRTESLCSLLTRLGRIREYKEKAGTSSMKIS